MGAGENAFGGVTRPSTQATWRRSPRSSTRASCGTAGRSPLAGDYQGRDATFAFFGRLGQETGGTFRAELQHLLADDERVIGIQRNSAERDGKHLDVDVCLLFQLKDGRVTEGWEDYRDLYAWDDFWS